MKFNILIKSLLTLSILAPVMAMAASNCEPANSQLSVAQRTAYIKQCLTESSAPENVKRVALQEKTMSCEQNAKNKALQGNEKKDYLTKCVNRNEAKEAAVRIRSFVVVSTR